MEGSRIYGTRKQALVCVWVGYGGATGHEGGEEEEEEEKKNTLLQRWALLQERNRLVSISLPAWGAIFFFFLFFFLPIITQSKLADNWRSVPFGFVLYFFAFKVTDGYEVGYCLTLSSTFFFSVVHTGCWCRTHPLYVHLNRIKKKKYYVETRIKIQAPKEGKKRSHTHTQPSLSALTFFTDPALQPDVPACLSSSCPASAARP